MGRKSRAKRERLPQVATKRRRRRLLYAAVAIACIATGIGLWRHFTKSPPPPHFFVPEQEVVELITSLLQAVNPEDPANAYFPPMLKQKLNWVWREYDAGQLEIAIVGTDYIAGAGEDQFMISGLVKEGSTPRTEIMGLRIWMWVRVQGEVASGFNQMQKNTFALALAHEAVHLEKLHSRSSRESREEIIEEERRTWYTVNMGVTVPLRGMGQPLETGFIQADDILKRCGYNPHCPEFVEFVATKSPPRKE